MLTLGSKGLELRCFPTDAATAVVRVTDRADRILPLRRKEAFLAKGEELPPGFDIYMAFTNNAHVLDRLPSGTKAVVLPEDYGYLCDGDIIRFHPQRDALRVLYRRNSMNNCFLLTERCNHYCLMCSQPPKDIDDSWIVDEVLAAIPLIDRATAEIGFTGGEPTLLGDDLIRILNTAKSYLPNTAIHVLSNGRRFADAEFMQKYAGIDHPDLMVGIPLYSDLSTVHDYVVQADGAYDETIRGILNLKRYQQKVEIRVVIHQQTYQRLPQLAEFIVRNLTFVDHIALMGLEITGFTRANLDKLWIDPVDYMPELFRAVNLLADYRMNVSIYNHQLCVLDRRLWNFARKSISDWKNEYMPECTGCSEMHNCGGFFASAKYRYSDHIKPFR
ncbi:MAG TPA: His-Xaa-Ser system radical SAM maturase HxsC [Blastocatellia bacterium]|nr:His-Xaa-Ser system radical SAM maturase HxsC [Blastocatellia bacterium]